MRRKIMIGLLLVLTFALASAEEKRKIIVDDYFRIKDISDIQISPDRKNIAFVKREIIPDPKKKGELKRTRDIFMLDLEDNSLHRSTTHEKGSSYPRWSPDGRFLAFLSGRIKENQIWLLDMEHGGEANQITDWKQEIEEFSWSPDSKHLIFISTDFKDEKQREEEKKAKKDDPYVITRTKFLYDGIGYFGDPRESMDYFFRSFKKTQKDH